MAFCSVLTGLLGRAPAHLTSRNQHLANNQAARCITFARTSARQGGFVAGDGAWNLRRFAGDERSVTAEIVSKLCGMGCVAEAVEALGVLVQRQNSVSNHLVYTVLKKCAVEKDLVLGRRVHALTVKEGYESDTFLCNHILRMYASHGRLQDAMDVFTLVAEPDAFMWSSIISAHVKRGQKRQAIQLYRRMCRSSVKPDDHVFVAALQACAGASDLRTLQQVHADVLASGAEPSLFVSNCLVDVYAKCGSLQDAQGVFDGLGRKDVVSWNAMIAGYSQQGMGQEALRLYRDMQDEGIVTPDSVTFVCLLQACARVGIAAFEAGQEIHVQIRECGHEADAFVSNSLVNMYVNCGSLEFAQSVFNGLVQKDVVTWTALIAGYAKQGMGQEALRLYGVMQQEGMTLPNSVTFVCLLQACASVGTPALERGKQLHAEIRKRGHEADEFVVNSLVSMYAKCGSLEDAQRVFDGLGQKDVVTWTTLITGYSQQDKGQQALRLYSVMQEEGMSVPDSVTFVCLLQACATVGSPALKEGKLLHTQIREGGYQADVTVANCLVNMYAKCGSLEDAQKVFDRLGQKNVVTWNAMISGYSQQGRGQEALRLYSAMQEEGIAVPDPVTFVCLLQACARVGSPALENGKQLHTKIRELGHQDDLFVASSLVNMYAKCNSLPFAREVFDRLGEKNVVMWNAMIAGYSQQGMGQEALHLYRAMEEGGSVIPNSATFVGLLQACATMGSIALEKGKQLHAQIRRQGLEADVLVPSSLVNMYAKCGSLEDAHSVFNELGQPDVATWNALIAGYSQQGMGKEALGLYSCMQEVGFALPDSVTFVCLLQACATMGNPALEKGRQLHAQIREKGHHIDVCVVNSLVRMYAKCGSLGDAERVFNELREKDVATCNAMIAGYVHHNRGLEALGLYSVMQEDASTAVPDSVTLVYLLQACASVGNSSLETGKQLHVLINDRELLADVFVANNLLNMYAKCGSLEDAHKVFDRLGQKDVVTWNAMIAGYSQRGMGQEALQLFRAMQEVGMVLPNSVTFVCLLHACANLGTPALEMGKQLHALIIEQGHQVDVFLASSLVNMYAKCGRAGDAQRVFDGLNHKDVVTWNAMIAGYSQQGKVQEAFHLYSVMQEGGVAVPDSATYVCLLQACASLGTLALEKGRQLHTLIRERGHEADVSVASSLVNMYAKCGSLDDAQRVFDGLGQRDVVTWTAMIAAYSQQSMGQEALHLYGAMLEEGMAIADSITFVCLLQACGNVAGLHLGRQLHAQIEEQGLQRDLFVAGSLINMYGKCGSMVDARHVFDALLERDVITWSALIAGYTCEGNSDMVFELVQEMREDGTQPDGITFLSVLTVCSHAGLVKQGREHFEAMSRHHGITPTVEHCTCMVDLFSRAGQLEEALDFVRRMPVLPNAAVWHTLLGACRKWSNVEVGRHAFNEAVKLDMRDAAAYVLMSSVYTSAQMWDQAREMQVRRKRTGAWKVPGQSWWTDMDGLVQRFLVGFEMHPKSQARLKHVFLQKKVTTNNHTLSPFRRRFTIDCLVNSEDHVHFPFRRMFTLDYLINSQDHVHSPFRASTYV